MMERYFTLQEANALIPWVHEKLTAGSQAKHFMLAYMKKQRKKGMFKNFPYPDNAPVPPDYYKALKILYNNLNDVSNAGIIIRDMDTGLIDFPCLVDGRTVLLCWRFGEEKIHYWHEEDTGFAGRQPLSVLGIEEELH